MRVFHVLGLRRFVKMSNLMNPAHYCFYADLLDVLPNFISCLIFFVLSVCIDIVENGRKRALVSDIVMILVFILDEAVGLLVNGVVGQMHTQVIQVAAHRTVVGLSSEPSKSFFVDEASERVYTRYQNINSEVKLQPINKVGLMKISLSNIMFTLHDPITIPSQKYTFALAHRLRLYDKCFGSLIVKLIFEALGICWENPSFREEVEKIRKVGLHVGQVSREEVFTGQNIAGWYVIYPLVGLHFEEKRGKNRAIYPPYVPVFLFVGRQPEICLVSTILQNFILCI